MMDAMKPHTNQMLVYIAPTLAAVLWFTYMTGGDPYYPPGPQTYRHAIVRREPGAIVSPRLRGRGLSETGRSGQLS